MLKNSPLIVMAVLTLAPAAHSAETARASSAVPSAAADALPKAEQVSVDAIKEKYWARGDESEIGVVQNRLYSKERKLEFSLFSGFLTTDPFLTVQTLGGSMGFNFNEYLSVHFVGWKDNVGPSSALSTFEQTIGATTNNNRPKYYLGGEGTASILYGKLSLIGKAIIYYDMHILAGLGSTTTESGSFLTPSAGLGQRFYITKSVSLRVDYRLQYYKETIVEKVITPKLGQVVGQRDNWSNAVMLGVDFLWGLQ